MHQTIEKPEDPVADEIRKSLVWSYCHSQKMLKGFRPRCDENSSVEDMPYAYCENCMRRTLWNALHPKPGDQIR